MPAFSQDIVLADFSAIEPGAAEGWQIVNDTIMGGRSESRFEIAGGALRFTGLLNTNGGGFASVRRAPIAVGGTTQDTVRLRVRGDGRPYQLRLYPAGSDVSYRVVFATEAGNWQVIDLPLEAFQATWRGRLLDRPPIVASAISGLGLLLADRRDGPFELWVRRVTLTSTRPL